MATTHSSVLAWKIPWTEEPGGLQSIETQKVGHSLANELNAVFFFFFIYLIAFCVHHFIRGI